MPSGAGITGDDEEEFVRGHLDACWVLIPDIRAMKKGAPKGAPDFLGERKAYML